MTAELDLLVVGSGVAGLSAAVRAAASSVRLTPVSSAACSHARDIKAACKQDDPHDYQHDPQGKLLYPGQCPVDAIRRKRRGSADDRPQCVADPEREIVERIRIAHRVVGDAKPRPIIHEPDLLKEPADRRRCCVGCWVVKAPMIRREAGGEIAPATRGKRGQVCPGIVRIVAVERTEAVTGVRRRGRQDLKDIADLSGILPRIAFG